MAFHQYSNLKPVHYYWFVFLSYFFIQEIIFLPSAFSNKASNNRSISLPSPQTLSQGSY